MPIELKHLRYTEAAGRYGSFRKAADALSLRQSNLSRRVRDLEAALGVALFERTNGGVRPTLAGREFIHQVRHMLDELQTVIDRAKAIGRGEAGYLTIGFYTSLSAGRRSRPGTCAPRSSNTLAAFRRFRSGPSKARARSCSLASPPAL